MPTETRNRLLRPGEVAEILGLSRSATYAAIQAGEIPSVRLGKSSVRVPAAALDAWITARTRVGASAAS